MPSEMLPSIDIDADADNGEQESENRPVHGPRRDKCSPARRRIARLDHGGDAAETVGDKYSCPEGDEGERGGRRVGDVAQKGDIGLIVDAGIADGFECAGALLQRPWSFCFFMVFSLLLARRVFPAVVLGTLFISSCCNRWLA